MTILGLGIDHALDGSGIASLGPGVEVVYDEAVVDGNIEDAQAFVVGGF